MDRQLIKTLIDALQASALQELEYGRDGETLRLSKVASGGSAFAAPVALAPRTAVAPALSNPPEAAAAVADPAVATAPLFGVVHLQRAPGTPAFVAAGQPVDAGQVLCTVEAMKVFTDVRAPRPGTVEAVLVADGQEVEPGQPLVRLA